jgi:hypothetical protein
VVRAFNSQPANYSLEYTGLLPALRLQYGAGDPASATKDRAAADKTKTPGTARLRTGFGNPSSGAEASGSRLGVRAASPPLQAAVCGGAAPLLGLGGPTPMADRCPAALVPSQAAEVGSSPLAERGQGYTGLRSVGRRYVVAYQNAVTLARLFCELRRQPSHHQSKRYLRLRPDPAALRMAKARRCPARLGLLVPPTSARTARAGSSGL